MFEMLNPFHIRPCPCFQKKKLVCAWNGGRHRPPFHAHTRNRMWSTILSLSLGFEIPNNRLSCALRRHLSHRPSDWMCLRHGSATWAMESSGSNVAIGFSFLSEVISGWTPPHLPRTAHAQILVVGFRAFRTHHWLMVAFRKKVPILLHTVQQAPRELPRMSLMNARGGGR